ncbi:MAG TPA: hypothetical protein VG101_06575 [Puia sp.]|jgi:hypothetical protein|nr:hypothetical protein [Puia sp.]
MANSNTILKNPALLPDQDYAGLRKRGLEYIQQLGTALWTDFNEHDPGITILEALCYSITELGYRVSLPMEDLLTAQDGTIPSSQVFFTAKQILTQSALTPDDYRKLLIDIPNVHNAWVQGGTAEVPLFADCKHDTLTYQQTDYPVDISGLYRVLLDLDDDPRLGDLNDGEIDLAVYLPSGGSGSGITLNLTLVFPSWKCVTDPSLFTIDLQNSGAIPVAFATFPNPQNAGQITITYPTGNFSGSLTLNTVSSGASPNAATLQALFTTPDTMSGYNLFTQKVFQHYLKKIQTAYLAVQSTMRTLRRHRNLCEDFVSVDSIRDEEIAFCFDIDVAPGADINTIQANVWLVIDNYLDPPVNFYLLKEMLAKKDDQGLPLYTIDQIFEGPRLKHGFIDTAELDNSQLVTCIHASTLISGIMAISGVLGVRNFLMTAYDNNGPVTGETAQRWCLKIKDGYKPVLSVEKSKVVLYKNQIPYLANQAAVARLLQQLLSMQEKSKLTGHEDDLPVPVGTWFPLDGYSSVQYLFPITYGIGEAGLPSTATDARKAQARQLKAFLLFFDQLLGDFLEQLKNAPSLFSTDNIVQTYYAQFLSDFPDYASIYTPDSTGILLQDQVLDHPDSTVAAPLAANGWERLYEPNETFTDRRNRFLDHLMARFAESFNEYAFLMYSLNEATQQETRIDPADLIASKVAFLKEYPRLSYDRAKAYDYCPMDKAFHLLPDKLWYTDNVSGLEEKLCLLGGFKDPGGGMKSFYRRFLRCIGPAGSGPGEVQLSIQAHQTPGGIKYNYALSIGSPPIVSPDYNSLTMLNTALMNYLTSNSLLNDCSCEGLYLFEHLLLRPRSTAYNLAPVCLEKDCTTCGEDDPYSFRISIVLPYWPAHFNNLAFRSYFEELAREEAPAHCMVKVCWINQDSMLSLELQYFSWIYALASYTSDPTDINSYFLNEANNDLLNTLFSLHSEYPVATLHDCNESTNTNPVTLGKTILGTINN